MLRDKTLIHHSVSTDFPIAAVRPLAKCLLRVRFIHLFLRYTYIVNLEGLLLRVYLVHLYSYQLHQSILVSDYLYNALLSPPLPVLVVAVTHRLFYSSEDAA